MDNLRSRIRNIGTLASVFFDAPHLQCIRQLDQDTAASRTRSEKELAGLQPGQTLDPPDRERAKALQATAGFLDIIDLLKRIKSFLQELRATFMRFQDLGQTLRRSVAIRADGKR